MWHKSLALQVSVIIVNYNVRYFLEQCLISVQAALKDIESEVIVIDNASTDDSKSFFRGRFPGVQFVYNKENIGFGAANNEAIAFAKGDYILLLNPDTLIQEDCIAKCISFLKSKNDEAALGVKMIDGSGKFLPESKRSFPDPVTSLYKLSGLSRLFPKSAVYARYYLGHLNENEINEIDVLAGAFIMLPRKILDEVKGFDEDFFMYGEDIDLSYRIQQAGFKNYYYPETTIVHFKGESTKKGSLRYVKMFYKAMSIFVKKHYGASRAGFFNTFLQIGILFKGFLSLIYRFLKWVSIPVLDVLLVFFAFWIVRQFWIAFLLPYLALDNRIFLIAFPLFAITYLLTSYYSGLYDSPYKPDRLYYGFAVSALLFFTVHALVPSLARFPRGVFLTSIFTSFIFIFLIRKLLIRIGIIENPKGLQKEEIAIVGDEEEYDKVLSLLKREKSTDEVLGRISANGNRHNTLGYFDDLDGILKNDIIKELIFCHGALSYKAIISTVEKLPKNINAGFYASGGRSIIRSRDKDAVGEYDDGEDVFRLSSPYYLRQKRLVDILLSSLFLIAFPYHLIMKKNTGRHITNCMKVLFERKTFVGYTGDGKGLPPINEGILGTTGFLVGDDEPATKVLSAADRLYAQNYSMFKDFRLIFRGYGKL